jgi:hypothetical protein
MEMHAHSPTGTHPVAIVGGMRRKRAPFARRGLLLFIIHLRRFRSFVRCVDFNRHLNATFSVSLSPVVLLLGSPRVVWIGG